MNALMQKYEIRDKGGGFEMIDLRGEPQENNYWPLMGLVDQLAKRREIAREEYIGQAVDQYGARPMAPQSMKGVLIEFMTDDIIGMVSRAACRNGICVDMPQLSTLLKKKLYGLGQDE